MNETQKFLTRVERINVFLSLGVLAGSFLLWGAGFQILSLLAGLLTGFVNLRLVAFLANRIFKLSQEGRRSGGYVVLLGFKLAFLMVICFVLVVLLKVKVILFLVGISLVYAVLMFEGIRFMGRSSQPGAEGAGESQ